MITDNIHNLIPGGSESEGVGCIGEAVSAGIEAGLSSLVGFGLIGVPPDIEVPPKLSYMLIELGFGFIPPNKCKIVLHHLTFLKVWLPTLKTYDIKLLKYQYLMLLAEACEVIVLLVTLTGYFQQQRKKQELHLW